VTLAEHYSIRQDETVDDVTCPADTAARGWLALAKEERIRRRPAEKAAVRRHGAPLLYLTRGDLPAGVYVERILAKLEAITRACAEAGRSRQEAPQQPRRLRSRRLAVGLRHLDHLGRVEDNPASLTPAVIRRLPDLPAHRRLASLAALPHVPSRPPGVVTSGLPDPPAHRLARLDVLPHLPSRPPGVCAGRAFGGEFDQPRSDHRVDRHFHQAPPQRFAAMPSHGTRG